MESVNLKYRREREQKGKKSATESFWEGKRKFNQKSQNKKFCSRQILNKVLIYFRTGVKPEKEKYFLKLDPFSVSDFLLLL